MNHQTLTFFELYRVYSCNIQLAVAEGAWETMATLFGDKIEPYLEQCS